VSLDRTVWERRLLLIAYGEEQETPEVTALLAEDAELQRFYEDACFLRKATQEGIQVAEQALLPPRNAMARALQVFEAEEPASWLTSVRSLLLLPTLATASFLFFFLQKAPGPRLSWTASTLDARVQQLAGSLETTEQEFLLAWTGGAETEAADNLDWSDQAENEASSLEALLASEVDALFSRGPEQEENWSSKTSSFEALDQNIEELFSELERL
jgi:hypothetical protein